MTPTRIFRSTLLMLPLLMFAPLAPRAASPKPLELVPAEALIVIEVPDVPTLLEQGDQSAFVKFYQDPRAAEFVAPLREMLENWRGRVTAAGVKPDQLRAFFKGSLALIGMPTGKSSQPIEWVAVIQHNGDATILNTLKAYKGLPAGVLEAEPDTAGGQTYTRVRVSKPVPPAPAAAAAQPGATPAPTPKPPKPKVLVEFDEFQNEDLLIHGGTKEHPIEDVLALFDSAKKNRIESAGAYKSVQTELKDKGDIQIYADVSRLMKIQGKAWKKEGLPDKTNLDPLALERFGPAGVAIRFEDQGLRAQAAWNIPSPRTGVPALAALTGPTPEDLAALFPPETMMLSTSSYPLAQAWPIALQTMMQASPEYAVLTQLQLASIEQATGVQLQHSLLDRLGTRIVRALLPGQSGGGTPIWLLEVREPALFRTALNDVIVYGSRQLGLYQLDRTEAEGAMFWTIRRGQPSAPQGHVLAQLAMAGGWLMISPERKALETIATRINKAEGASLAGAASYKTAAAQWPAERVGQSWSTFQGLYRAIEAGAWPKLEANEKPEDGGPFRGKKLPGDDVLNAFFGSATGWRTLEGDWMRMEMHLPYAD